MAIGPSRMGRLGPRQNCLHFAPVVVVISSLVTNVLVDNVVSVACEKTSQQPN